jgi:hypothetical protein
VADRIRADGGITIHPFTGDQVTAGMNVAMVGEFPNQSGLTDIIPLDKFSANDVKKFYAKHGALFAKDKEAFLGGWVSDGKVYLDVSRRKPDVRSATKFGELENPGFKMKRDLKQGTATVTPTGVERTPEGTWPRAQEAVFDAATGEMPPVGNLSEFLQGDVFRQRVQEMFEEGQGAMQKAGRGPWWDITKGPLAMTYGQSQVGGHNPMEVVSGMIASTSPQNAPAANMQLASELIRRAIKGEPIRQPAFRAPSSAMGPVEPAGFSPGPGMAMPGTNTWANNAEKVVAGRNDLLQQDKVQDMYRALMGEPDVAVVDRHFAKIAEDPASGVYTAAAPNKVEGSMDTWQRSAYADIENALRDASRNSGMTLSDYSATVWEGIRSRIKNTGELFGQQHGAGRIPETVGGFNEIFEDLLARKASHLGIDINEMVRRLAAGDAELLTALLATGAGAGAASQLAPQGQQRPAARGVVQQ